MMNKAVILISAVLLVLCVKGVSADVGRITLLAVYNDGVNFSGSPADLQLEIQPGSGRIFLETIPVSKVDTQISTRFAKQMACKFAEVDCDKYDFFYTIRSTAGIVGGPSAGGAIATLTAAMLMGLPMDPTVSITGTINSGSLIGPVGSLKEKIDAAKMVGVTKVLIPAVQQEMAGNLTSVVEYGESVGVEVVPVNTLAESLTHITGTQFADEQEEVIASDEYTEVMKEVSDRLCTRAEMLTDEASTIKITTDQEMMIKTLHDTQEARNLTQQSKKELEKGNHYSAASYCFRASLAAQRAIFRQKDDPETEKRLLTEKAEELDERLEERDKNTITDLQTYMIVKERVIEAKDLVKSNDSDTLAFAKERLNSAEAWSLFFGQKGESYDLDEESLKRSCEITLNEVEERFQYLSVYFPGLLADLRVNLDDAHEYYLSGEYPLCIFLASRTKAEANIIVTLLGVKEDQVQQIKTLKLNAAKKAINDEIKKGTFPILAYSYYEYSNTLDEEISSVLYAEYALELSDIGIYLEKKKNNHDYTRLKAAIPLAVFIWGVILGYLWGILKYRKDPKKTAKRKPTKSKHETRIVLRG